MEIVLTDRYGHVNWYLMDGPEEIGSGVMDDSSEASWQEALTLANEALEREARERLTA
jgi:hypothetical protein